MNNPKEFAEHTSKVFAGILIKVVEGTHILDDTYVGECADPASDGVGCGTCPTCRVNKCLSGIGSDAGLALAQATAYRKKLEDPEPFGHYMRKHGFDDQLHDVMEGESP